MFRVVPTYYPVVGGYVAIIPGTATYAIKNCYGALTRLRLLVTVEVLFHLVRMTVSWTTHDAEPRVKANVPFLRDLLNDETIFHLSGAHMVETMIVAKSGKGIMLRTEAFIYWLWSKDPACRVIQEHIDSIHKDNDLSTVLISVEPRGEDLCVQIGIDTTGGRRWLLEQTGTYTQDFEQDYTDRSDTSPRPPVPRPAQPAQARKRRKSREPGGV